MNDQITVVSVWQGKGKRCFEGSMSNCLYHLIFQKYFSTQNIMHNTGTLNSDWWET